jgi:hypothetical protein
VRFEDICVNLRDLRENITRNLHNLSCAEGDAADKKIPGSLTRGFSLFE